MVIEAARDSKLFGKLDEEWPGKPKGSLQGFRIRLACTALAIKTVLTPRSAHDNEDGKVLPKRSKDASPTSFGFLSGIASLGQVLGLQSPRSRDAKAGVASCRGDANGGSKLICIERKLTRKNLNVGFRLVCTVSLVRCKIACL